MGPPIAAPELIYDDSPTPQVVEVRRSIGVEVVVRRYSNRSPCIVLVRLLVFTENNGAVRCGHIQPSMDGDDVES